MRSAVSVSTNKRKATWNCHSVKEDSDKIRALPRAFMSEDKRSIHKLWEVMDDPDSSRGATFFAHAMEVFVLLTAAVTLLQSIDEPLLGSTSASVMEVIIDVIFALELIVRFIASPDRRIFFLIPYTWIDILAACPLILRLSVGFPLPESANAHATRVILLCAVPIFRLLKLLRNFTTFRLLLTAVACAFEALPMLLYMMLLMNLTFSTLIYAVEPRDNIGSFPQAIWFCTVTMTTVGYGDITPTTPVGYGISVVLIITSMLFMAVPIGIIGNTFNTVWNSRDRVLLIAHASNALIKWGYTVHDIALLFEAVDVDGNGSLDMAEFCELLREMKIGLSEERAIKLFEFIDIDGNGAIEHAEFARALFPRTYLEVYPHGHTKEQDAS